MPSDDEFEWDLQKSDDNIDHHGIAFEEARDLWLHPEMLVIEEDARGYDEDRYHAWGTLPDGKVLLVVHTYRAGKIRIISAREANAKERRRYYAKVHQPKR